MSRVANIFIFAVMASFLGGCSSSNDGAVLPEVSYDENAPVVLGFTPSDLDGDPLSGDAEIVVRFDERLDLESIDDSLTFNVRKLRDIYKNDIYDRNVAPALSIDSYIVDTTIENALITVEEQITEERLVISGFDEVIEDVVVDTRIVEREATSIKIAPERVRLALATAFTYTFDRGLKDLSPIESVHPISQLRSTGNFIENNIEFVFQILDGEWNSASSVNTDSLAGNLSASSASFNSYGPGGALLWKQQYLNESSELKSGVYSKSYDAESQSFISSEARIDYLADLDSATSLANHDVLDQAVDSYDEHACIAWTNLDSTVAPITTSVLLRCLDESQNAPRIVLTTLPGQPQIFDLNVEMLSDSRGVVTFRTDGVLYVYAFNVDEQSAAVVVADSLTFGDSINDIVGDSVISASGTSGGESFFGVVYTSDRSADASVDDDYAVSHVELAHTGSELRIVSGIGSELNNGIVDSGSESYSNLSLGFDYRGAGFAGWLRGSGIDQTLYTARYDGNIWGNPASVPKNGLGAITAGEVFVYTDGQASFAWVQDTGSGYELKVQGYHAVDGGSSFTRPSAQTLDTSTQTFEYIDIVGDRQGNAMLHFYRAGSLYTSRFLHNTHWVDAWASPELITNTSRDGSASIGTIFEDGRLVLSYVDDSDTFDEVVARTFSDFE